MLMLPVALIFIGMLSLGVSLILAATTLRFRDLHHIIPFLVNFGIWFTPVFYPVSLIPEKYASLIYLNPMASLIEIVRWSLFGDPLNIFAFTGVLISVIVLGIGVLYFKRVEDKISELV
jgi:lipopolysaccharide transport system permease protein